MVMALFRCNPDLRDRSKYVKFNLSYLFQVSTGVARRVPMYQKWSMKENTTENAIIISTSKHCNTVCK